MSASAQGLCEFIDASPSPFHVCATAARRLTDAGFTELSESDAWPSSGRFFTLRAGSLVAWIAGVALAVTALLNASSSARPQKVRLRAITGLAAAALSLALVAAFLWGLIRAIQQLT